MRAIQGSTDYSLFGFRVRSALELPELFPASGAGDPDVTIETGEVAAVDGAEFDLKAVDGGLVLAVPDVARFKIADGSRIIVDPAPDVPDRNVRIFLLGSAFGALLHQRGLLPLHANAIAIGGRAVAFMGESGAGKSTLAAWFHQQGDSVIADDVCVVGFNEDGRPFAAPGLPRLRLWAEALKLMGGEAADYNRSYVGDSALIEKFDVPIDRDGAASANVELAALYLLERGDKFAITELKGVEAAEAVIANTYRGSYLSAVSGQKNHWQSAMKLVRAMPVYRVSREWDLAKLDEQCQRLRDHAAGAVGCRINESG